jgi:hypothetical protein
VRLEHLLSRDVLTYPVTAPVFLVFVQRFLRRHLFIIKCSLIAQLVRALH